MRIITRGFAMSVVTGIVSAHLVAAVTTQPVETLTNGQLIDRLTDVTNREFSVRSNIFAVGGGGTLPRGVLMTQQPGPTPSPAMSELMRRGVAALPDLIAHLDDDRATASVIKGMAPGIKYSAEYDWNPRTAKVKPKGTVEMEGAGFARAQVDIAGPTNPQEYVVKVGDLCFNLIGQIVNRRFQAVRYQPSAIVIVNSPVLCPDLREAVHNEWAALTVAQHRASIIGDVTKPANAVQGASGLALLAQFYPDAVTAVARERLKTPMYEERKIRDFALNTLYVTEEAEGRTKLIEDFVNTNGPAYRDGLIVQLWKDRHHRPGDKMVGGPGTESIPRPRIAPVQVLAQLVPNYDSERSPQIKSVDVRDTDRFIDAMAALALPELDQMIWETFVQYSTSHAPNFDMATDGIAMACLRGLAHKGHDAEFRAYARRRYDELPNPWPKNAGLDPHRSFQSEIDFLSRPPRR